MDIFEEINPDEIIKTKAMSAYRGICQELVETNDLKPRVIEICNALCNKLIADEKGKDPLTSYERTLKDIKREINNI